MRKIILIFSLLALLLFVMPVAAADTAPSIAEGEDGSIIILLNQFVDYVTGWYADFQNAILREQVVGSHVQAVREAFVHEQLSNFFEQVRRNALGN